MDPRSPGPEEWFLTASERGNDATVLDDRHPAGTAWSHGNLVRPLIHGATYFAELYQAVEQAEPGDVLMFADWRGDADERLTESPDSEVGRVFSRAAVRGVRVHGLVWRSHWDNVGFSARENRRLDEVINAAGGCCLLDMRVRTGGSHHQKFVVVRHPARPELDVAFVGGIDLCHSRRDDAGHRGDPQRQPMAKVYGARPPWHDVQVVIRGPAVGDVETVFRERWEDPQPQPRPADRRPVAGGRPYSGPAPGASAAAAGRPARGAVAAHLRPAGRRLPVRPKRGAQRGPRLPEGAEPRPAPRLPGGPVPVVP
jgi:phosphatidylserine/phosphatidylglycerophosphate/cardiolipin synthase-like enzyme